MEEGLEREGETRYSFELIWENVTQEWGLQDKC